MMLARMLDVKAIASLQPAADSEGQGRLACCSTWGRKSWT